LRNPRRLLAYYSAYLDKCGLITGSEGNLSIRDVYGFWITPSSVIKRLISPKDICFVSWDEKFVFGKPSSEWGMHLGIYKNIKDAEAVVHTHSTYALVLDKLGFDFDNFSLAEAELLLGKVGIVEFFPPGSKELWEAVVNSAKNSRVLLLRGHGVVTWAETIEKAANLALIFEKLCFVEYLALK